MTINFPCDNCICVPICRHKLYSKLLIDCSLLRRFISVETKNIELSGSTVKVITNRTLQSPYFRCALQTYLNPTAWEVNDKGLFTALRKDLTP